jgi:hypothetical protein
MHMLTVEGPWSPDHRRKLSPREESKEEEPLSLEEIAARIETESPPRGRIPEFTSPAGWSNRPPAVTRKEDEILMQEFVGVRQREDEGFRRLFENDYFKLWVWYDHDKTTLQGFQLLWGGDDNESAITWKTDGTFSHHGVASEEFGGAMKMTQVLEGDAGAIRPSTIYIFRRYAAKIDQALVELVVSKVMQKTGITQEMMEDVQKEYRKRKAPGT